MRKITTVMLLVIMALIAILPIPVKAEDKTIISTTFEGIEVYKKPKKTEYLSGEVFKPKGMKVKAVYKNVWSDGSETYTYKKDITYKVDTSTPLMPTDTEWKVASTIGYKTCTTMVHISVKNSKTLKQNYKKKTLYVGDTLQLRVYGTDKYILWSNDYSPAASVSDKGVVSALNPGKATLTATIGSGKDTVILKYKITVKSKVSVDKPAIFLTPNSYEAIKITPDESIKDAAFQIGVDWPYSNQVKIDNAISSGSNGYIPVSADGLYNVVPVGKGYTTLHVYSGTWYETGTYSQNSQMSFRAGKVVLSIPVFIYPDNRDTVKLLYARLDSDKRYISGEMWFSGYSLLSGAQFGIFDLSIMSDLLGKGTSKITAERHGELNLWELTVSRSDFEQAVTKAVQKGVFYYGKGL